MADTKDEIEKIMNEIDELQKEMSSIDAVVALSDTENSASPPQEETQTVEESVPASSETVSENEGADLMKDFHGSSEDASMEETLGDLKADEVPAGKSILDEPTVVEEPIDEEQPMANVKTTMADVTPLREVKNDHSQRWSTPTKIPSSSRAPADGKMTLTLSGSINLSLKYDYSGEEVTVGFEDEYLFVELSDGTEFKIPVGKRRSQGSSKSAA